MAKFYKNKTLKFIVKAAVSLGFIAYVILKVNWLDVLYEIRSVSLFQVLLYMVVLVIGMVISSYKWKFLAAYKGFNYSLFEYFKYYLTGTFINNFMPSFVGGDAYKAYQMGRNDKRYTEAASTVMVDRITGLVGAMILALIFSLLNIRDVLHSTVLIVVNILVVISFFSDVLIAALRRSPFWKNIAMKILPVKIQFLIREIYSYGDKKGIIKKAVIMAMVYDIIGIALVNYILFWALNIHISFLDYMSAIFLTNIVASVPITINNIGIKEWSYISFFGALGISSAPVITIAILSRVLQMIVSFFALPAYLKRKQTIAD